MPNPANPHNLGGRVLLLQDAGSNHIDPGRSLHLQGYVVLCAATAERARLLLQQGPDLVLADVDLLGSPTWGEHARDFLQECRHRALPALLFSGTGRHADLAAWAVRGAGLLLCPDSPEELDARMTELIARRRLRLHLVQARWRLRAQERQQAEDLRSAAQIQHSLIPRHLPATPSFGFAWHFEPCAQIGGDLFNIIHLDEDTILAYLFDVSGHGVSSAMVSVALHQSLSPQTGRTVKRQLSVPPYYTIPAPAEVFEELEGEYPFERFEKLFTIVYALLSISSGRVRYCCAGHPGPLLVRSSGAVSILPAEGGLIGLGIGGPFAEKEVTLQPGDRLYLYSDGIVEAGERTGELFGTERLCRELASRCRETLEASCLGGIDGMRSFCGALAQQDDVTLLGIEYRGA